MKATAAWLVSCVCLVLGGCENSTVGNAARIANRDAEAKGFPFRWEVQSVDGGDVMFLHLIDLPSGPTRADATLKRDVLQLIAKAELTQKRANPRLKDVRHLPDGREVWILESATDGIAYIITVVPAAGGGTDIELSGPTLFHAR